MNSTRIFLALLLTLASAIAADSAFAWGRSRVGIYVGVPLVGFPYYYPPYPYYPYYYPAYYPSPVMVQQQPTVYVERQPAPQAPQQQQQPAGYWYYCNESRAYYPYVKECASPWQRVAPQPG